MSLNDGEAERLPDAVDDSVVEVVPDDDTVGELEPEVDSVPVPDTAAVADLVPDPE